MERNRWEDPDVDGKIILRWISGNGMCRYGLDLACTGWRQEAGIL
jgi:hypothetical protein